MRIVFKDSRLFLRNSITRLPFRYGKTCLSRCPQAVLQVNVRDADSPNAPAGLGYSGDCLPPGWFDKSPHKDFREQVADMLRVIAAAQEIYALEFAQPVEFFDGWLAAQEQVQKQCSEWGLPPLLASFGSSLCERAILDAVCRIHHVSFSAAVRSNLFGVRAVAVHPELAGSQPADWLPPQPSLDLFVRQTVGLSDPLTLTEVPLRERLTDGWPQTVEEYITRRGVCYFKVKVSNRLEEDIQRLLRFARLLATYPERDFWLTLDGNEQYHSVPELAELLDALRGSSDLLPLWRRVLVVEQPLDRGVALSADHTLGLSEVASDIPIIIDESDGALDAFPRAITLGYRGVSSKNCKSPLKSLLNAGLCWSRNRDLGRHQYVMTGEDLCSVGVIPTQADLCLAATLGFQHVERNGHHYHPGLSYLPEPERQRALAAHGDFYVAEHGIIGPRIENGRMRIGSLQCVGFGFAIEPDLNLWTRADAWSFDSLSDGSDGSVLPRDEPIS